MELTRIMPLEKWGKLESDLFKTYNLQGSVFNTDGIRITNTKNWANQLCPAIKSIDKGQSFICAVAHMNMSNQARQTKKAVIEECDAGLLKLVVPIFFNGEYLGVIGGCGLLAEDGEVDEFAINKITDMDYQKIEDLSAGIPVITYEKARAACEFLETQLDMALSHCKALAN
jgi:ligand-binding sensor protein